jgi:hypothetical protein
VKKEHILEKIKELFIEINKINYYNKININIIIKNIVDYMNGNVKKIEKINISESKPKPITLPIYEKPIVKEEKKKQTYGDEEKKKQTYVDKILIENKDKIIIEKPKRTFLGMFSSSKPKEEIDNYTIYKEFDSIYGGFKGNPLITLREVFILHYNCLFAINDEKNIKSNETLSNIYKLYFLLNIYSYYYLNNEEKIKIINDLKDIIKRNEFSSTIIIIQELVSQIYNEIVKIYEEEYLKVFNETDCIIKNYYLNDKEISSYLHYNFIYPFYKNIEKNNININLTIDGVVININKTYQEIINEINLFFKSNELIMFPQVPIIINRETCYKKDIHEFMKLVYNFTNKIDKNQTIIIDNMNDLNAIIVIKLLSSSSEEIEINIKDKSYKILNIKNHPYEFSDDIDKIRIRINLTEIQEKLYELILKKENIKILLGLLSNDYYFLNFDISKEYKFKFNINYEILEFLNKDTDKSMLLVDFNNLNIINYNNYDIITNDYSNIHGIINILQINKGKIDLPLIINYTIFFISSLFVSQTNYNNFITLIYLYFGIRTNNTAYLSLINYKGTDRRYLLYKEYLSKVNLLNLIEDILKMMRVQLNGLSKIDEKKFTNLLINFKNNEFVNLIKNKLKLVINLDNALKFYRISEDISKISNEEFNKKLLVSLELIYETCIIPNKTNKEKYLNLIKLRNYLFIPLLKHLSKSSNIKLRDIEIKITDLNAIEVLSKYPLVIQGGNNSENKTEKPNVPKPIDINQAIKQQPKPEIPIPEFVSSTKVDSPKDIIEYLDAFNKFLNKFEKLSISGLVKEYENKLVNLLFIKSFKNKDKERKEGKEEEEDFFITSNDFSQILPKIDKETDKDIMPEISQLDTIVNNNKRKISEELELYQKKESEKQQEFLEIRKLFNQMKENLNSKLIKYKNSNNDVIRLFLADFYPQPEDDDKRSLLEIIEDYLNKYEKRFKIYEDILKDSKGSYEVFIKSLNDVKRNYEEYIKNKARNYNRNTNNPSKPDSGGGFSNLNKIIGGDNTKKLEKLKQQNDKIKDLFDVSNINIKNRDNVDTNVEELRGKLKGNLDKVKKNYKRLRSSALITDSVDKDKALEGFIDNNGDNLFERMLYQYNKDAYETNTDIAKNNFYDVVKSNDLDPKEVLEVNFYDKLTFAFIVIGLRLASLYITYIFIDRNIITSIKQAVYYYTGIYVIILMALVLIVNIDVFRLRIIFNYLNMHSNTSGIIIQIIIAIIIGYIVYYLIINLNTNEKPPTRLSKNQKIKLKYKIDILTIIMLIFIVLLVLII